MRSLVFGALALLLGSPLPLRAQAVRGVILDQETGDRIAGVAVDALRGGTVAASAQSDARGNVLLVLPAPGRYALRLAHPSYLELTTAEMQVGSDTAYVELRLGRTSIPLRPLIVQAAIDPRMAAFQERMRRGGSGQFMTRDQIQARPGARTTDLLRQMTGVAVASVSAGGGRRVNIIRLRGGAGTCEPTIYVDGIQMRQFVESPLDDLLKPDQLAGVEVYTSAAAAPPPLTPRDACGVVAFWTRPVENVERFSWTRIIGGAAALLGLITIIVLTR